MKEIATFLVNWKGDGIPELSPYTPDVPDLSIGGKWEDISVAEDPDNPPDIIGIPGGTEPYTIKVTADTADVDAWVADARVVLITREEVPVEVV
jgi:hypothetical protein